MIFVLCASVFMYVCFDHVSPLKLHNENNVCMFLVEIVGSGTPDACQLFRTLPSSPAACSSSSPYLETLL